MPRRKAPGGRAYKPIAADAWENGRWQVEWSEMPASVPGHLPLSFSRVHPVRCLWCGRELRELVAHLMTHHLRLSGELDAATVSRETVAASP